MSFRLFFAERLKTLRLAHNLSSAQLAALLFFKNKGSISHIESGKALPSAEALDNIQELFAISLDWLNGSSDVLYRVDIIEKLENKLIAQQDQAARWMMAYKNYATPTIRDQYSLSIRANIIFCFQVLRKYAIAIVDEHPQLGEIFINFLSDLELYQPILSRFDGARKRGVHQTLCSMCYDYLQDYIVVADSDSRKRTTPVFDVEAAWKELQAKNEKE